jgi:hypothetical protein
MTECYQQMSELSDDFNMFKFKLKQLEHETKPIYCICIPRVSLETTKNDILTIFTQLLGSSSYIHSIKVVSSHSSTYFQKVFIELYSLPDTENGMRIRRMIEQEKTIKIAYHPFMFWKCVKGRTRY